MTLNTLLSEILEIEVAEITDQLSRSTHQEWTSLRHVQLITTLEEFTNVSFTSREMAAIDSVRQLRDMLMAKGVPADAELSQ
jgi:acyl carrier protein